MSLVNLALRIEPPIHEEKTVSLILTDSGETLAYGVTPEVGEILRQGIDARDVLLRLFANFPVFCFCDDHDTETVNGADLVDWITSEFYALYEQSPTWKTLIEARATHGTPDTYDGVFEVRT